LGATETGWTAAAARPIAAAATIRTIATGLGGGAALIARTTDVLCAQLSALPAAAAAIEAGEILAEIREKKIFKFESGAMKVVPNQRKLTIRLLALTEAARLALRPLLRAGLAADLGPGYSAGAVEWTGAALAHTIVVSGAPPDWPASMIEDALARHGMEMVDQVARLRLGASPLATPDWTVGVMATSAPTMLKVPASATGTVEVRLTVGIVTAAPAALSATMPAPSRQQLAAAAMRNRQPAGCVAGAPRGAWARGPPPSGGRRLTGPAPRGSAAAATPAAGAHKPPHGTAAGETTRGAAAGPAPAPKPLAPKPPRAAKARRRMRKAEGERWQRREPLRQCEETDAAERNAADMAAGCTGAPGRGPLARATACATAAARSAAIAESEAADAVDAVAGWRGPPGSEPRGHTAAARAEAHRAADTERAAIEAAALAADTARVDAERAAAAAAVNRNNQFAALANYESSDEDAPPAEEAMPAEGAAESATKETTPPPLARGAPPTTTPVKAVPEATAATPRTQRKHAAHKLLEKGKMALDDPLAVSFRRKHAALDAHTTATAEAAAAAAQLADIEALEERPAEPREEATPGSPPRADPTTVHNNRLYTQDLNDNNAKAAPDARVALEELRAYAWQDFVNAGGDASGDEWHPGDEIHGLLPNLTSLEAGPSHSPTKKPAPERPAGRLTRAAAAAAAAKAAADTKATAVELAAAEAALSAAEAAYGRPEEGEIMDPTQITDGVDNGAEEGEVARAAGGPALA
jgi:hypothetical protein